MMTATMRMMIKMMMRRGVTKIIALYWHPRYLYSGSNPSKRDNQGWHCVSHKPKKLSDRNELKLGSGGSRKGAFKDQIRGYMIFDQGYFANRWTWSIWLSIFIMKFLWVLLIIMALFCWYLLCRPQYIYLNVEGCCENCNKGVLRTDQEHSSWVWPRI